MTFTRNQATDALNAAGFEFDAKTCTWSNGEVVGARLCYTTDWSAVWLQAPAVDGILPDPTAILGEAL